MQLAAAAAAGGGPLPPIAASAFDGSESQLAWWVACEAAERLQGLLPPHVTPPLVAPPPYVCAYVRAHVCVLLFLVIAAPLTR